MAFIPTPNGVKVEVEYLQGGKHLYNILTIDVAAPVTDALVSLAASTVAGWAQVSLPPWLSNETAITKVFARGMDAVESFDATVTSGFPVSGSINSPALPNNVAMVVSFKTGFTGRSAHGRVYLPGATEVNTSGNTISGAEIAGILGAFVTLRDSLASAFSGGGLAVTSFIEAGIPRTEGRQLLVTSFDMDSRVDSQRRRL